MGKKNGLKHHDLFIFGQLVAFTNSPNRIGEMKVFKA